MHNMAIFGTTEYRYSFLGIVLHQLIYLLGQ